MLVSTEKMPIPAHIEKTLIPRMLGLADLDLLEAMMEPLEDCPFFVKNHDFQYVAANSSMARFCGLQQGNELIGHTVSDFFPLPFSQYYENLDRQVLHSGLAIRDKLQITYSLSSKKIGLLFNRTPIRDSSGNTIGIVGTARRFDAFTQAGTPDYYCRPYHPTIRPSSGPGKTILPSESFILPAGKGFS
ncbi:PAS domain-containing protein [Kerstersia gyiorum]|uniref:PAS domain-containing protein n=1 Tax=Kerstersia gyiorum TaxID=206506 RepID=UPI0020A090E1|nr:PAS domain-containing protein [Kerstersia gyiorum]MCP1671025.1 PAS domain-containing protein [Kerstersia gyiorum]MCP1708633.1 PAS domain-containing protein [Kerstersia gyiorum]